jgi:hypothetical protein
MVLVPMVMWNFGLKGRSLRGGSVSRSKSGSGVMALYAASGCIGASFSLLSGELCAHGVRWFKGSRQCLLRKMIVSRMSYTDSQSQSISLEE